MQAVEEGLGREGVCGWGGGSTGKGLGRGGGLGRLGEGQGTEGGLQGVQGG